MRKIRKQIFTVMLTAVMLFTMPGTAAAAAAEDFPKTGTGQTVTDDTEELKADDSDKDKQETETNEEGSETDEEDADPSLRETVEEELEDEGQENTEESSIRVIEDLIADLPDRVTEDHVAEVQEQLEEILDLYRELTEEEQEQIDLTLVYSLLKDLDSLADNEGEHDPTPIPDAVGYQTCDADGKNWEERSVTVYTEITSQNAPAVWADGWYVVTGDVAISGRVTVSGEVHLILTDGCSLTTGGITVESDNGLSIYAQSEGGNMGSLTARTTAADAAGIGGSARNKNGGTITIYGGHIIAQGGDNGAGIGSGNVASGGRIAIHDGNVEATGGGNYGVGIGGYVQTGTTILITGGIVTAKAYFKNSYIKGETVEHIGGILNGEGGCTVTFQTNNTSVTIPSQTVSEGKKATRPEMEGWLLSFYTDEGHMTPFDFGTVIEESITIYVECAENTDYIATVNGTNYTSVSGFVNAIQNADGPVTATLLKDVDLSSIGTSSVLTVPGGVTLTLDCGKFTLSGSGTATIQVNGTLNFKGGTIRNEAVNTSGGGICSTIYVIGTFNMSGGMVDCVLGSANYAVEADLDSTVKITAGIIGREGMGLGLGSASDGRKTNARLSGGTYSTLDVGRFRNIDGTYQDRPVSEILAEGYALKGADGQLISGDATGRLEKVAVVECTHPGQTEDLGNGTHGAAGEGNSCPYCGTEIAPQDHTPGEDGKCTGCGVDLVAQAEIDGKIIYYGSFKNAWMAAHDQTATVTLLDNVTVDDYVPMVSNGNVTFNGGEYTLTFGQDAVSVFQTNNGTLTIAGGTISAPDGLVFKGTVYLQGGKFIVNGITSDEGVPLWNRLSSDGTCYAFYRNDQPVPLTEIYMLPAGTYEVKVCKHDENVCECRPIDGTDTHQKICLACGYTETHDTALTAVCSGKGITVGDGCAEEGCTYSKTLGTITFTIPANLTYNDGQTIMWTASDGLFLDSIHIKWMWNGINLGTQDYSNPIDLISPSSGMPLPAGSHTMEITVKDGNREADPVEMSPFTIQKTVLTEDMVTLKTVSATYNGTEQEPVITVKQGEAILGKPLDYEVSCFRDGIPTEDLTSAGTITLTIEGRSDYTGTVTKTYTIAKAPLTITASDQEIIYGQSIKKGSGWVSSEGLCGDDSIDSVTLTSSATKVPGGTITVSDAVIKNADEEDVTGNYAVTYQNGNLTVSYMDQPETILYNEAPREEYYGRKEVRISAEGYTVCDSQDGEYQEFFTIPVPNQTDTVTKTLYFSQDGGRSEGVKISVNFDLTPPVGKVKIGPKWWETLLGVITFGHYKAQEYTITIESGDAGGSGIARTEYAVTEAQYTNADALAKATEITWKEYKSNSEPKVPTGEKCIVYARLTDKAGNVSYISTDGILLDETAPDVAGLSVTEVKAETVDFTFTVDEAADHYYVVLPKSADKPDAADIIATVKGGTAIAGCAKSGHGEVTEEQITDGKATVKVTAEGLTPGTAYQVYVTAVDKAVDFETGASDGNVGEVKGSGEFTMKKLDQAAPTLSWETDSTDENNVKITIKKVDGARYSFDGGSTWNDTNEREGFTASQTVALAIQMKETATHNASPVQTVEVDLARQDQKAPGGFTLKCEPNGETDYTVTIPAEEGCEYSFDGQSWSDNNVKTGVKAGETVTGYKRYKENDAYNASSAVSASETMQKFTVKTPVISPAGGRYTEGVSVTITCVSPDAVIYYTTNGSTPTSSSTRYTGAFTVTPTATVKAVAIKEGLTDSAVATVSYTNQNSAGSGGSGGGSSSGSANSSGEGKENVDPGAAETQTAKPGYGTKQGKEAQNVREPFIKGADGKIGWDPSRGRTDDINFSVKKGVRSIPVDIVNNVTGENYSIQISLSYEGEFGFTTVLSVNIGEANAGYTASLYYYRESTGELEWICSDEVARDGTVSLTFTHASDYVIAIDDTAEEEDSGARMPQDEDAEGARSRSDTEGKGETVKAGPKEVQGQGKDPAGSILAGLIVLVGIGAGIVLVRKRKKE